MAWNEPGGGNKDPWGNRKNDGPPELDEIFRRLQDKLGGLFGGRRGGSGSGGSSSSAFGVIAIVVVLVAVWFFSGLYIVDEGERGVELRFGKYSGTTLPGPHWYPPIIESVDTVNVTGVRAADGSAQVLTGDENIVQVTFTVQYNIKDAAAYLFNVDQPDLTLQQASESAFRELIGKNSLDYVIQDGRDEVPDKVRQLLQENLDLYGTGLEVINVNLIDAQPPQEVQDAFDDAIKAREDKERIITQAEAYANEIIPKARGDARRQIEEAMAYEFSVVKAAQGETARFTQLLGEYQKAPKITRERLYLETLESVLAGTGKVMVDVEGGNNLMYLPLDKIVSGQSGRVYVQPVEPGAGTEQAESPERPLFSNDGRLRSREAR
ncbi:MAG TPA: FtsH protease activity modulator HflK [Gammaproteobacteria bacterium]